MFGPEAARGQLFHQVNGLIGDQAAGGQRIVENAHRSGGTGIAAIISFVLLAGRRGGDTFSSLNTALNIVWLLTGEQRSSIMTMVRVWLVSSGRWASRFC